MANAFTAIPNRRAKLSIKTGSAADYTEIKGLTNLTCAVDNESQSFYTYDSVWANTVVTGKKMSITFEGKRIKTDAGQNAIVALVDKDGDDAVVEAKYEAPDKVITGSFAVSVSPWGGGDANDVAVISGTLDACGAPTITDAA